MRVAYLLSIRYAKVTHPISRRFYEFSPWAEVSPDDWPWFRDKIITLGAGCCGRGAQQHRVFATEEEVTNGVAGFLR